ncbi:LV321 protein, partial [Amia calva]|nr:LV321 protein [Amia calva]
FSFFFFLGDVVPQVTHPKPYIIATPGKSKRVECELGGSLSFSSTILHWYRQREGEAIERILYQPAGKDENINDPNFKERFAAGKQQQKSILTISSVQRSDAATYYCAYWDSHSFYIQRKSSQ